MRRLALLGLSGVGKTTFMQRVAVRTPVAHLEASALIKAEQAYRDQQPASSESLRTGPVLHNQALLIAAFNRTVSAETKPIVFDGHCVIDGRDGLVAIPGAVFAALGLDAILFLTADPDIIAARRRADAARTRPDRDAARLHEHQTFALEVARRNAHEIGCPFIEILNNDVGKVSDLLNQRP